MIINLKNSIKIKIKSFLYFFKIKKLPFEQFLIKKIIKNNNIIFDIGANYGQSVDKFLITNKKLFFYIFEPHKKYYLALKKKFKIYKNIKIFNLGVGKNTETRYFYSTKNRKHQYAYSFNKANYLENKKKVKIISLDDDFLKLKKINFLKIDVEGLEYEVLCGSKKILKKNQPFLFLEVTSSSVDKCFKLLENLNFEIKVYEYSIFINPNLGWLKGNVINSNIYDMKFYNIKNFLKKKNKSFVLNLFVYPKIKQKYFKNYSTNSIKLP